VADAEAIPVAGKDLLIIIAEIDRADAAPVTGIVRHDSQRALAVEEASALVRVNGSQTGRGRDPASNLGLTAETPRQGDFRSV
jgi:hypothetical protein